jgi:hypothetical protein
MRTIHLFLLGILFGVTSLSFAMERGGHRDFNRGDINRRGYDHYHRNDPGEGNVYINPQGSQPYYQPSYNYDPFPDSTEADQIYEENLQR